METDLPRQARDNRTMRTDKQKTPIAFTGTSRRLGQGVAVSLSGLDRMRRFTAATSRSLSRPQGQTASSQRCVDCITYIIRYLKVLLVQHGTADAALHCTGRERCTTAVTAVQSSRLLKQTAASQLMPHPHSYCAATAAACLSGGCEDQGRDHAV